MYLGHMTWSNQLLNALAGWHECKYIPAQFAHRAVEAFQYMAMLYCGEQNESIVLSFVYCLWYLVSVFSRATANVFWEPRSYCGRGWTLADVKSDLGTITCCRASCHCLRPAKVEHCHGRASTSHHISIASSLLKLYFSCFGIDCAHLASHTLLVSIAFYWFAFCTG